MFKNAMLYQVSASGEPNLDLNEFIFRDPGPSKLVSSGLVCPATLEPDPDSLIMKIGKAHVFAVRRDKIVIQKSHVDRVVAQKLECEGICKVTDKRKFRARKRELTEAVTQQVASLKVDGKPVTTTTISYGAVYDGKLILSRMHDETLLFAVKVLRCVYSDFQYEPFFRKNVSQFLTNIARDEKLYETFNAHGFSFGTDWKFECDAQKGSLSGMGVDGNIPEAFLNDNFVVDKATIYYRDKDGSVVHFKLNEIGYLSTLKADFSDGVVDSSEGADENVAGEADLLLTLGVVSSVANTLQDLLGKVGQ